MATYTGQTLRLTAKSDQTASIPATWPGAAPGAGTTGTLFTFSGFTDFRQYNGPNAILFAQYFTKKSNILIERVRLSIPNIAGARLAPGYGNDDSNGARLYAGSAAVVINPGNSDYIDFNLTDLNEWIPVNLLIGTPDPNESFHLTPYEQTVYVDTRNIQAVYAGIDYYMQVDIDVFSPFAMLTVPE